MYKLLCCRENQYMDIIQIKQEGPEGPGMLTWDRRFLKVPFFHCYMYNRRHWEV